MKTLFFIFGFFILSIFLSATIINVPGDQPTVQQGINVAVNGDTVLVQPGDYQEMINFNGKNIVVGSLFLTTADSIYIDSTIIRYNINWNYVVTLKNNESCEAMLIGFKIGQGGISSKGIHCSNSSPQIKYNHIDIGGPYGIRCDSLSSTLISENLIENADRGVQISYGASPTIINNKISNVGKGIFVSNSSATIISNEIIGSSGVLSRGIETGTASTLFISSNSISNNQIGIQISNNSQSEIINNFITDCLTGINCLVAEVRMINNTIVNCEYNGIDIPWLNQPEIINCIVWGNPTNITLDSQAFISHSCIEGGIPINSIDLGGNISRNPCFINPNANDFTLLVSSPCIEAGTIDTTGLYLPEFDLVGNDRIQDGNGDNIFIIDMGCYEAETITDPGYISGTISLLGGTGNVEDVNVGVGAPVHPDENGDYLITIGTSASPYDVTAWLDNYLPQTIYGVEVLSGEITENVDFELEYYQPDTFLEFTPDSLFFITQVSQDFKIKNISLIDVNINAITFAYITGSFYYYPYNLPFPQLLTPNDSLECIIYLDLPTLPENRELLYDSLFVVTDVGQFTIPIIWDSSLINDADDNTIQLSELNLKNFPNPFKPSGAGRSPETTINYQLPEESKVQLTVYNIKGQKVKQLVSSSAGQLSAGEHSVVWDSRDNNGKRVSSGIYFYKLKVGGYQKVKKMILIK